MKRPYLAPRQEQVIRLASLGCTTPEISAILGIAVPTVCIHKGIAMRKLGVKRWPLAVRLAIKYRYTSVDDKLTAAERRKSGRKNDGWN